MLVRIQQWCPVKQMKLKPPTTRKLNLAPSKTRSIFKNQQDVDRIMKALGASEVVDVSHCKNTGDLVKFYLGRQQSLRNKK